jgi:predicted nuclease of predicted toxin-antitoxin system
MFKPFLGVDVLLLARGRSKNRFVQLDAPVAFGGRVKLLIDECLHTSLVELAHAAGHVAHHVNYLGLGSSKDWQLMATIRAQDYTFVTNNRSDFLTLHGQEPLHPGVIVIVPNVTPLRQRELFSAALKHIGPRDLTNTVVEVKYTGNRIVCSEYALPRATG